MKKEIKYMREVLIAATKREFDLKRISQSKMYLEIKHFTGMSDELIKRWYNAFFTTVNK